MALLTAWGPDASAAVPELLAALEAHPLAVPKALAAVHAPEHRTEVARALARKAEAPWRTGSKRLAPSVN